jgi:O-antigen/teichoic acid export membrane protein
VTARVFPAAAAGLVVNVVALVALVDPLGIAGAGIALCAAYLVMLLSVHLLTRRAFAVPFEWRRLGMIVLILGGASIAGELLLPTAGLAGFAARAATLAALPALLVLGRVFTRRELASFWASVRS